MLLCKLRKAETTQTTKSETFTTNRLLFDNTLENVMKKNHKQLYFTRISLRKQS